MVKDRLPAIPKSTQKSIRLPNIMIDEVENIITGTEYDFSKFVVEAVRLAIEKFKDDDVNKIIYNNINKI